MPVQVKHVFSLGEYMDCISEIEDQKQGSSPSILWFRGQSNIAHTLIPSLYRSQTRAEGEGYTQLHYAEDIRTQHYVAKNYHFFEKEPSSRVEWLEVMQHHSVKTRVLDWSESSLHSLLFSLEAFFEHQKFDDLSRQHCVPCVWVLQPQKLNRGIFQYIKDNDKLHTELLEDLSLESDEKKRIKNQIQKFSDFQRYSETDESKHIDYILNLSQINDEILNDRARIKELLKMGEVLNPYFYLIARIYSDGYVLDTRELPPLAVVHPYHSERIKSQKGVFAVFPYYKEQPVDKSLRNMGIVPDAMEYNAIACECLHKIIIHNPQKVALQLMKNGLNDSWLYPELPIVANEIEYHKIY